MHVAGSVLAGRYRLDQVVAERPGATTWHGVDVVLDRPVRVRLVEASHPHADAVLAAARSRSQVEDHRAGNVIDADLVDGLVLVVTVRPLGDPLSETLSEEPLDPLGAMSVVREVAEVLVAAHEQGLAHLRLAPESVVIGSAGEVTLLGLAVEAALRGEQLVDGTGPAEQDTRGLGALLYACLTGRWPDEAAADSALQPAPRAGGRTCTPRQVRAAIKVDVDTLCRRAMGEAVGAEPLRTPAEVLDGLDELIAVGGRRTWWPGSWLPARRTDASRPPRRP